jgi:hypothetical protein
MYLRTISRRNKDGSQVRYVQFAHNVRHPESGNAVAQVLHSFGREDQLAGRVQQRTELTTGQPDLLRALQVAEPPRFLRLGLPPTWDRPVWSGVA